MAGLPGAGGVRRNDIIDGALRLQLIYRGIPRERVLTLLQPCFRKYMCECKGDVKWFDEVSTWWWMVTGGGGLEVVEVVVVVKVESTKKNRKEEGTAT